MRPFLLFIFSVISCAPLTFGQQADLSHLMNQNIFQCNDIRYNCLQLIPSYYRQQKFDSVSLILAYWKDRCGANEEAIRMDLLLSLREKSFDQKDYGALLPVFMQKYRDRNIRRAVNDDHQLIKIAEAEFDVFTQQIAKTIELQYAVGSVESAICNYYLNEFRDFDNLVTMNVIEKPVNFLKPEEIRREGKLLPQADSSHFKNTLQKLSLNLKMSMFIGGWQAIEGLNRDGKMLIGTAAGLTVPSVGGFEVSLSYAGGSGRYENLSIGLEPHATVFESPKAVRLNASLGFAMDWLTCNDDEFHYQYRSNGFTFGIEMQRELNRSNGTYLGVQVRYHLLEYPTHATFDLNGDAVSIRFVYGAIAAFK